MRLLQAENPPLGISIPLPLREKLLAVCRHHHLLILEDNPYGMFRYDGEALPTLKSLDTQGTTIYFGTFSKTLCPGLRLGYLVADQHIQGRGRLSDLLSQVKSFFSVNTGQINQAVVGGLLLETGCSLKPRVKPMLDVYRQNRNAMLKNLDREFSNLKQAVCWNVPAGGFFIHVQLPVVFGEAEVLACAKDYGVICVPMSYFAIGEDYTKHIRLSFSYVDPEQIDEGVRRLGQFIHQLAA